MVTRRVSEETPLFLADTSGHHAQHSDRGRILMVADVHVNLVGLSHHLPELAALRLGVGLMAASSQKMKFPACLVLRVTFQSRPETYRVRRL